MVLDPIPQPLHVHFFGSRPQPPTSPYNTLHTSRKMTSSYMWHHVSWICSCHISESVWYDDAKFMCEPPDVCNVLYGDITHCIHWERWLVHICDIICVMNLFFGIVIYVIWHRHDMNLCDMTTSHLSRRMQRVIWHRHIWHESVWYDDAK